VMFLLGMDELEIFFWEFLVYWKTQVGIFG
jgi:hypothetical protein